MKIPPFSKRRKYLFLEAPVEGGNVYLQATLPFMKKYGYGQDEGRVSCIFYETGNWGYAKGKLLYIREDMWDNQEVRDLFYQLVEVLPDLDAITKMQDMEKMERLL